jgi:hypothetical protein
MKLTIVGPTGVSYQFTLDEHSERLLNDLLSDEKQKVKLKEKPPYLHSNGQTFFVLEQ